MKETSGDKFTYEMKRKLNVFGASMEDRIVCQLSSTHVVKVEYARQGSVKTNVPKNIKNPQEICRSMSKSFIFGFCAREGNC